MKLKSIMAIGALSLSIVACKNDKKTSDAAQPAAEVEPKQIIEDVVEETTSMSITLEPKSDSQVSGTVEFTETNNTVTLVAKLNGLTQGTHAIHIHQTADCSSPDGKSTGGHWNPTAQPHGKWGDATGYHKGDIGNFEASETGEGFITLSTDEWCIGCGDDTKDILGKAIIVHQGQDDFTSQPSGAAGARVSCAGIIN